MTSEPFKQYCSTCKADVEVNRIQLPRTASGGGGEVMRNCTTCGNDMPPR